MIKLVLSDMDNTMLPYGLSHVPQQTIDAIRACQEQGIDVGPCTGRTRSELSRFFSGDASCYNTGVMINGLRVYLTGAIVHETKVARRPLARVARIASAYPQAAVITYWDDNAPVWVGASREEIGEMYHRAQMEGGVRAQRLPDRNPMKAGIIFMGPESEFLALREQLSKACPEFDFPETVQRWCDIIPRGLGKADGIRVLRRILRLRRSEICVFGDADNDLDMLRLVPNSVCVANGNAHAHAAARWHIGASADGAVASALFDIAQAARSGGDPAFMCEANRNHNRVDEDGLPVE